MIRPISMHAQRGQTLPVWIFGVLSTLMLAFIVFDYANTVRWQIRAQNAADSVAQGILSVQANHYNSMLATLHTAAIEEWRIRKTMNALLEVMQGSGGCGTTIFGSAGDGRSCITVYKNLRNSYIADVGRYTQLVQQMQAVSQYSQADQIGDMQAIITNLQNNCTTTGATSADCEFTYTMGTPVPRTGLSGVANDEAGIEVGVNEPLPNTPADLQPLQMVVNTCAQIISPFQTFFHLNAAPYYAIGRAAATTAMVTQEWFNPGTLVNPNSPTLSQFQPPEFPESATNAAWANYSNSTACNTGGGSGGSSTSNYDWYAVQYCSNASTAHYTAPAPGSTAAPIFSGFTANVNTDELSTWTGWWSALPIPPSSSFTPAAATCNLGVAYYK